MAATKQKAPASLVGLVNQRLDPGPPPPRPAQPIATYGNIAADQLYGAATPEGKDSESLREAAKRVQAVDLMRQPPVLYHYKADLLEWLGALDRYYGANPNG